METLKQIESKLRKGLKQINDSEQDCFLTKKGIRLETKGEHNTACELCGTTLEDYLNAGGCRIKINADNMAIESGSKLSEDQIYQISTMLRSKDFGYVVYFQHDTCKQIEIYDFNKVRPYQFTNALENPKKTILVKNF